MWDYPKSALHTAAIEAMQPERDREAAKAKLAVDKLHRKEDAVQAVKEREAERTAVIAKTQRLRAERLEREAASPKKNSLRRVVKPGS
jgi:hypothetical protein